MSEHILFHITTKEDWKEHRHNGNYEPESLEEEGFIHASTGDQLNDTANRLFSDHSQIHLLVIDIASLENEVKYEESEGEEFPHIYGPLNTNAVIDNIDVGEEMDGSFDIAFSSS